MGKKWDYDVPSVEVWQEALRVLKPGGYLLSFAGTRTQHRMAVRIEDAGFEIRDMIMYVYGSGFPKSLNINKQLLKKISCGNMEEYERNNKKTKSQVSEMWKAIISSTLAKKENNDRRTLQEVLEDMEQGEQLKIFTSSSIREEIQISERQRQSCLERWSDLPTPQGELYCKCKVCSLPTGIFINGKKRWICYGTQTNNGETSWEIIDENGVCSSYQSQSTGQSLGELNVVCEQCGTQIIRSEGLGSALKPACEPITVARKPISEKNLASNFIKWGVGGINIDECRVGTEKISVHGYQGQGVYGVGGKASYTTKENGADTRPTYTEATGRFPANLCWTCSCEPHYLTGSVLFDILNIISNQIKLCLLKNSSSNVQSVEKKKSLQDMTSEEKMLCFAVENVDTPTLERILGKTLEVIFNEDTECSVEMLEKSMNTSLSISLSGNEKMEEYQKVLKYITLTATNLITELKTYKLSQSQIIGSFITKVISGIQEQSQVKSHSPNCEVVELFPNTKSGSIKAGRPNGTSFSIGGELGKRISQYDTHGDSGSAARFFYCAKASKSERNKGLDCYLTVKYNGSIINNNKTLCKEENMVAVQLLQKVISEQELVSFNIDESGVNIMVQCHKDSLSIILTEINRIIGLKIYNSLMHSLTNESTQVVNSEMEVGGSLAENVADLKRWILTITKGNQELALGASRVVCEMLQLISVEENWKEKTNTHATVKPIALMEYLIKLVSKEGHLVLDPFAGSGSTLIACQNLRRNFIGIEREPDYIKIAESRLKIRQQTLI